MNRKNVNRYSRVRLFLGFLIVGLVSLVQTGCGGSSSSGGSSTPSVITAVSPENNNFSNLVSSLVLVEFSIDMNPASVANSVSLASGGVPVSSTVVYNPMSRIATLTPDSDLMSGVSYTATVSSSVLDTNGSMPLASDFVWSFGISERVQLVSKTVTGVVSNQASQKSDVDGDGRFTVFESTATNLSATTNGPSHIYRKDNITGEVILVSTDATGLVEANDDSSNPAVSNDGRYVVFESSATDIDPAANLGTTQIFLKDLVNGTVRLVSNNDLGQPDNSSNSATSASVSDDGQFVVFESAATNLSAIVSGGVTQVYRKNTATEVVEIISRDAADNAGNGASTNPAMSADGSHIVFESVATNLNASSAFRHIYYVNTNVAHLVVTASVTTGGADATGNSNNPSISDDGSIVVFESDATNLDGLDVNGFNDVFYRDQVTPSTGLVSLRQDGFNGGNGTSSNARVSGNGDYVVFESLATDLVAGDTNGIKDVFVRNLSVMSNGRVNNPYDGSESSFPISPAFEHMPVISRDGRYVGFHSEEGYTIDDTDAFNDVFRAYNITYQ